MTRKGIILAGGSGTRLYPATRAISKQLMPIYDKPMIYYPLSTMMLTGRYLRYFAHQHAARFAFVFNDLLGDGKQWGINLSYAEQNPHQMAWRRLSSSGADFIGKDPVAMILGDNLYYGQGLHGQLPNDSYAETERRHGIRLTACPTRSVMAL